MRILAVMMSTMFLGGAALAAEPLALSFDSGIGTWRVVLDGVMGGRSSGRVSQSAPGVLKFTGALSLENNGGFSQMRTNVTGDQFAGAEGIEIRVRGDGRKYNFDIRCENVRLMAGGFQQDFQTVDGEWKTIRLPFKNFRLYSFGREVPNAPALERTMIESIGVTLSDKKPGAFGLELDSIRAYGNEQQSGASGTDLASVARAAGLNTLLQLVAASELELPAGQSVTIFAPTDEAFAALPESTRAKLLRPEGRQMLRSILTYHITTPATGSTELLARRSIGTLNGQRLSVGTEAALKIGESMVLAVDVSFDQGVVHVIDRVLIPQLKSIADLGQETEDLGTLMAAVGAAGLGDQLSGENGPWTVFAPVNSAFAKLPSGVLNELLQPANRSRLTDILGVHVVPGRLYTNELLASQRARTLFGKSIEFRIESGRLRVGDANIVAKDIEASNGVIHLIDAVILPMADEPATASRIASGMRICERAISLGVPLFNDGQTEGCAAVYEMAITAMIEMGADELGRSVVQRLEMGLAEGETQHGTPERAWTYRRALDEAYLLLSREG